MKPIIYSIENIIKTKNGKSIRSKGLVILLVILFLISVNKNITYSASREKNVKQIKEEVKRINSLTLTRVNTKGESALGKKIIDVAVYLDSKNRIRKLVRNEPWGPFLMNKIEYFTVSGEICYLIFLSTGDETGYYFYGNAYFKNGRSIKVSSIESSDNSKTVYNKLPGFFDKDTSEVKRNFNLTNVISSKYRFRKPVKGDKAILTNNNVILRSGPTTKSKIVKRLSAFDVVKIISKGKIQNINPWGSYSWYSIDGGWVFGAFLEPVGVKLSFAENKKLWKRIEYLNNELYLHKKYIPEKKIRKIFNECTKILKDSRLDDEFEKLREEAFKKDRFSEIDLYVERCGPVFNVVVMGESNNIGINVKYFYNRSDPKSIEHKFFMLAKDGFYVNNDGFFISGTSDFPLWVKRTGASFQGKFVVKAARKYLIKWKKLRPRLKGIYRVIAKDTVKGLNDGIKN